MNTLEYAKKNQDKFVNTLIELLKIPSVSAQSNHQNDMHKHIQGFFLVLCENHHLGDWVANLETMSSVDR